VALKHRKKKGKGAEGKGRDDPIDEEKHGEIIGREMQRLNGDRKKKIGSPRWWGKKRWGRGTDLKGRGISLGGGTWLGKRGTEGPRKLVQGLRGCHFGGSRDG